MAIYKIEAEGDTVYVEADNEAAANKKLVKSMGFIPRSLLKFTVVDALPAGEEFLA